jgi:membrane associated rhomboid family serine protease
MSEFRQTRPNSFPPVVKNLIIINVLVFVAQMVFENQYHLTDTLALYPVDLPDFKPYQLFTHMFTHSTSMIFHIVFNMFTLWMFGRVLENVWGPGRFLFFYLACGIGAAACHLLVQHLRYDPVIVHQLLQALATDDQATISALAPKAGFLAPAVGASGAIMGVMAGFAYLFPNTELFIMLIPFPVKAKWAVLGLAAIDLFSGTLNFSGDNIAHFAHLGGAITGFIIVLIWNKTNRKTLY